MFVEPEAIEAKTTIKADPSAPARSAIRRQRTVRYTPHVRDRPSSRAHSDAVSREIHQRRLLREFMRHRDRESHQDREQELLMLEAEQESARAEAERAEAGRLQRLISGRAILRDALSYERPSQRMRMLRDYGDMPDLVPITDSERSSYPEVVPRPANIDARAQTRENAQIRPRSPPPGYMPTPPYSFSDSSSSSSPHEITLSDTGNHTSRATYGNILANESMEEYVARVGHRSSQQAMLDEITRTRLEVERTREEVRRTREEANRNWREIDVSLYDSLDELPPLRRMGRRHGVPSPLSHAQPTRTQSHVDGLGDRRRSFSPEDDAWDTLLTTITPDERVPSVHSSFTSATASASASFAPNPASASSYSTLATLPPSLAMGPDLLPPQCDDSDSEDSLTEDETPVRPPHHLLSPSRRPVYSRRYDAAYSDRAELLASHRRLANADIGGDPRVELRNEIDMTYDDRYRRNRLRHLGATEMGSERAGGVRPARERL